MVRNGLARNAGNLLERSIGWRNNWKVEKSFPWRFGRGHKSSRSAIPRCGARFENWAARRAKIPKRANGIGTCPLQLPMRLPLVPIKLLNNETMNNLIDPRQSLRFRGFLACCSCCSSCSSVFFGGGIMAEESIDADASEKWSEKNTRNYSCN